MSWWFAAALVFHTLVVTSLYTAAFFGLPQDSVSAPPPASIAILSSDDLMSSHGAEARGRVRISEVVTH